MNNFVITAFYQFFDFANYKEEQQALLSFCKDNDLKGTVLIAHEGINSTISGSRDSIDALYGYLT
ncbi:putative rhodanese-related sulfurtransferase, partial [Candidatus Arcanobacter lacustris]